MAFDPTILLEARAEIEAANTGKINRSELRMPNVDAARAFMANTPGLIATDLSALKNSSLQPVKVPVFQKIAAGSATTRALTGTGTGTTAFVTLSYQGIREEFAVSELEQAQNMVGRDRAFTYLVAEKTKNIYKRINDACKTFLETNKSPVNGGSFFGVIDGVELSKRVAATDKSRLFSGILSEMAANDFRGPFEVVGEYNLMQIYNEITNQGSANDFNTGYTTSEFSPYFTSIANGTGVDATGYVFEPGTVGIFPWTNALSRQGADIGTETWTTFQLPAMPGMTRGLEVELKVKRAGTDNSATITGGHADLVEGYVMYVDFALVKAYSSTTDTFIYKYELLSPA